MGEKTNIIDKIGKSSWKTMFEAHNNKLQTYGKQIAATLRTQIDFFCKM